MIDKVLTIENKFGDLSGVTMTSGNPPLADRTTESLEYEAPSEDDIRTFKMRMYSGYITGTICALTAGAAASGKAILPAVLGGIATILLFGMGIYNT